LSKDKKEKKRKMKISRNKPKAKSIALILTLTFAATLLTLPIANAHTPSWNVPTQVYITVNPNPIGVGQTALVVFWVDIYPPTASGKGGDRWRNYKVEVTKPNGDKQTLGPFTSDPVGSGYTLYTPDQVGTYTFEFSFPGQVLSLYGPTGIPGRDSPYINDTFVASSATTTLTVQQEPIPEHITYPLPTEYWTRPIEGQNIDWWTIASNWLGSPQIDLQFQPDGIAPNSAHIMWTKPIQSGGVVGGSRTGIEGMTYYSGTQYEAKFRSPLIMNGKLYYDAPLSNDANDGPFICVDLLTGETLWENPDISPSFGQLYDYESMNQHGVIPNGYLWSTNFGDAYDPFTGDWLFSLTDVPRGTEVYGSQGEILRYVLNYPGRWLALWNNTAAHGLTGARDPNDTTSSSFNQWRPIGKTVNMSQAYSWNVTIPDLPGLATPTIMKVIPDVLLFGRSTELQGHSSTNRGVYDTPDPYTFWVISLKPDSRGELLWIKNYAAPPDKLTVLVGPVDAETGVFTLYYRETMQWFGYDIYTGDQLWGPTPSESAWNYYSGTSGALRTDTIAYGKLYSTGFSGIVYCYDLTDGTLLWTYNNTYAGFETPYGAYPLLIGAVADGKIYLFTSEHSANAPPYKGAQVRVVDTNTGKELWTVAGWAHTSTMAIADGYLVYNNLYDMQIYCIGKGPTATTVTAPDMGVPLGSSLVIRGRVTDESAGTKQNEQAARFPNGVPAISDEDQSEWMEYVYMQKPIPADATGVEVTLDAVDPNGNFINIGTTTSDMSGFYSYKWKPENEGKYTIIATFEGSDSYYCSYAETAIGVDPAPAPAQPIEPEEPTAPLISTEVAIIAAVAVAVVIGIVTYWALRKRK
jgi:outer membrane protein assembly factor BamB